MLRQIDWKDSVFSVMDEIKASAREGAEEGRVCAARRQSGGRGRLGRPWISPPGGLYAAILLRPDCPVSEAGRMTVMAGVAVCELVREYAGVEAWIKWPNDILFSGKKLAGILTESGIQGQSLEYVVLGIGLNANTASSDLPLEAVSLRQATGQDYDHNSLLENLLDRIFDWRTRMSRQGFAPVHERWTALSETLGQTVCYEQNGRTCRGLAQDLAEDGGLVIRDEDGLIVRCISGEIRSGSSG